ncbi:MAG TPA: histidine kinase [Ruminiclostridium sp.]
MDILKKNSEKYLLQQFSQADYNIQNVLNNVDRLSKIFSLNDNIQQFLQDNYSSSEFKALETQKFILDRITQFISNYDYISSIYIFTENKGGIGGSDTYTSIVRENTGNNFFESGMYDKVKKAFPKAILEGGITESFYRNYETVDNAFVLSFARGLRPIYEPSRSATIVFNIDEKYLSSIYANSSSLRDGSMCIVDENGKVISGSNIKSIGKAYEMFSAIDIKKDYGSFTSKNSGDPIQVVYYKLKSTGLYLVGEVPLQYFSGDIIILRKVIVIVLIMSFFAIFIVSFFWLRKLTKPLNIIAAKMSDVSRGNLGLTFSKIPKNEFGIVIRRFNEMSVSIVDLIRKNDEIQEGKRELEIEALQYQINPHFLYNTLNMIKWMAAGIKAKNIVDCIIALGNMLKPLFKNTEPMCTIKEELEYLENYIKIINWRFSNSVCFKLDIKEEFYDCKLPRFILQPIVENSINHGIQKQGNKDEINISAFIKGTILHIIISDSGKGIDIHKLAEIKGSLENPENTTQESSKGSIGLYNINRRIKLNFGDEYGIWIGNGELGGAKVIVKIPVIH